MKYMLMLYENEAVWAAKTEDEMKAQVRLHEEFGRRLVERGTTFTGGALTASNTATTLTPDGTGGLTVSDGPFIELQEHLGGYYVVEAADLDEALLIAKRCPIASAIEIRPLWA